MLRPLTSAVLAIILLAILPTMGQSAGNAMDYEISTGHFYSQANGSPLGANGDGFTISDDQGIPFWSEFQRLGGVERLGYPISSRFLWHGMVSQITQKAVLQSDGGRVQLVNVVDFLAASGKDDWLRQNWLVPSVAGAGVPLAANSAETMRWLASQGDDSAAFLGLYATAIDPLSLYGLPTSQPIDFGAMVAIRFQRTVLQFWKIDGPGVAPGVVTSLNVGDVLRSSGIVPDDVFRPKAAPADDVTASASRDQVTSRSGLGSMSGVATWYGADFQGSPMRNGEPYNMHDPTTVASNTFALGTWLRVTNLANGSTVEVQVRDTGAFRYPIVVDLSFAAFSMLDNPSHGVINVVVQELHRE